MCKMQVPRHGFADQVGVFHEVDVDKGDRGRIRRCVGHVDHCSDVKAGARGIEYLQVPYLRV